MKGVTEVQTLDFASATSTSFTDLPINFPQ